MLRRDPYMDSAPYMDSPIAASSIVIDPNSAATLYAALDGAGVYKSTDNGQNWIPASTQPANKRLKALVINKTDSTKGL